MSEDFVEKYFKRIVKGLETALDTKHLHHAYILIGPEGSGKSLLASYIARTLLKTKNRQHPDILTLNCSETDSGTQSIRNFVSDFQTTPIQSEMRIGILQSLHNLELQAQNSLLKCLEEPPKNHVLIATATSAQFLLPTIKSRAVVIYLPRVKQKDAFSASAHTKGTEKLLSHFYCGQVDWIAHVQENDITEMSEVHSRLSDLQQKDYLPFIQETVGSLTELQQLRKKIALWILYTHNSLRRMDSPSKRLHWTHFLEACINAYQANSISSSRLILERICT